MSCRILEKVIGRLQSASSIISRVPLTSVSSIVNVQIHWLDTLAPTRKVTMMIENLHLVLLFASVLDPWFGPLRKMMSLYELLKKSIMVLLMLALRLFRLDNSWVR